MSCHGNYQDYSLLNDGSVQSAALGLAHEMGHAAQDLDGVLWSPFYDSDLIEADNLTKYETPIARQLGEPIRSNYGDTIGTRVMSNVTHYVNYQACLIYAGTASALTIWRDILM